MAIDIGFHIAWRWQGAKSCCWLTCIEMLMQHKYGTIYGKNNVDHSAEAKADRAANNGSRIERHAEYYNLRYNQKLFSGSLVAWKAALRKGPVLAEGNYGWSRLGIGSHVILIAGVSRKGKLAFYNPNIFAVLPHPKDKISYMEVDRCMELADFKGGNWPFWQVTEDIV